MNSPEKGDPVVEQEAMYRLPYHWFPEERLQKFEREEKQRLIYSLINSFKSRLISSYLDVGCGDGRWTTDIHHYLNDCLKENTKTVGIDISERAIRFAKLITPYIDFTVGRAENIPYPSERFDLVTAIEVIEHIEDSAEEQAIHEMRRVLRKDGLLILTAPTWNLKLTSHHFLAARPKPDK
jgi:ubiquinone/menaquinone biosynthesis C-methylase UbiE